MRDYISAAVVYAAVAPSIYLAPHPPPPALLSNLSIVSFRSSDLPGVVFVSLVKYGLLLVAFAGIPEGNVGLVSLVNGRPG